MLGHAAASVARGVGLPLDGGFLPSLTRGALTTVGKLRNYELLAPLLARLGVACEAPLVEAVATEARGAGAAVLLRLRQRAARGRVGDGSDEAFAAAAARALAAAAAAEARGFDPLHPGAGSTRGARARTASLVRHDALPVTQQLLASGLNPKQVAAEMRVAAFSQFAADAERAARAADAVEVAAAAAGVRAEAATLIARSAARREWLGRFVTDEEALHALEVGRERAAARGALAWELTAAERARVGAANAAARAGRDAAAGIAGFETEAEKRGADLYNRGGGGGDGAGGEGAADGGGGGAHPPPPAGAAATAHRASLTAQLAGEEPSGARGVGGVALPLPHRHAALPTAAQRAALARIAPALDGGTLRALLMF